MGLVFTVMLYSAFPFYPLSTANSISTTGNLQRRLASEGGGNSFAKSQDTHVELQIIRTFHQWGFLCLCCVWAKPTKWLFLSDRWQRRNKMFHVVCFCMSFLLSLVRLSSFSLFNCTGLQLCWREYPLPELLWNNHSHFHPSRLLGEPFFSCIPPPPSPFSGGADAVVISSLMPEL